jgi:hypothetical protein
LYMHSLIRWWYLSNWFKFRCNPYCNSIFTEQISCQWFGYSKLLHWRREAFRSPEGIYLTQQKYIIDLLKRGNMDKAKPCNSHMTSNSYLNSTDGSPFEDISASTKI